MGRRPLINFCCIPLRLQDTQALENSGINPSHIINNHIVSIHRYKRLYSKNSAKFVRVKNGKVDGYGDKHDPDGKWPPLSQSKQFTVKEPG